MDDNIIFCYELISSSSSHTHPTYFIAHCMHCWILHLHERTRPLFILIPRLSKVMKTMAFSNLILGMRNILVNHIQTALYECSHSSF